MAIGVGYNRHGGGFYYVEGSSLIYGWFNGAIELAGDFWTTNFSWGHEIEAFRRRCHRIALHYGDFKSKLALTKGGFLNSFKYSGMRVTVFDEYIPLVNLVSKTEALKIPRSTVN